jgi:acyl carrier protein
MTLNEEALIAELKRFLAERNKDVSTDQSKWLSQDIDEFGFDSVDKLDLVMAIEDRFSLIFDANDVIKCRTLGEIAEFVERILKLR